MKVLAEKRDFDAYFIALYLSTQHGDCLQHHSLPAVSLTVPCVKSKRFTR